MPNDSTKRAPLPHSYSLAIEREFVEALRAPYSWQRFGSILFRNRFKDQLLLARRFRKSLREWPEQARRVFPGYTGQPVNFRLVDAPWAVEIWVGELAGPEAAKAEEALRLWESLLNPTQKIR